MNKNILKTNDFIDQFNKIYKKNKNQILPNIKFGFAVPAINLYLFKNKLIDSNFILTAQNMHHEEKGSFTGEVSVLMLKDLNIQAVLLGHSERRLYCYETSELVAKKAFLAIKNKITPIIIFGETLEQHKANQTLEIIQKQIEISTKNLDLTKIILAYEPIWAVGSNQKVDFSEIQKICAFIRKITFKDIIILYGGSVNPQNIKEILIQEDINGVLVGGASLNPQNFFNLLI